MSRFAELALIAVLLGLFGMLAFFLGPRVLAFGAGLSLTWFVIALILLSRPPGVPEFVSDEVGSDEQHVVRKDVLPVMPLRQRIQLSLSVACGACFLLWISLISLKQ